MTAVGERMKVLQAIKRAGPDSRNGPPVDALTASAETLLEILESKEAWWIKSSAIAGLRGRLDAEAIDRVLKAAQDPSQPSGVRSDAVRALADTNGARTEETLYGLLKAKTTSSVYGLTEAIVETLGHMGSASILHTALTLRCDDWAHRRRSGILAAEQLRAKIGDEGILKALGASSIDDLASHEDPVVRRYRFDTWPSNVDDLLKAIDDPSVIAREGIIQALIRDERDITDALTEVAENPARIAYSRALAVQLVHARKDTALAALLYPTLSDARLELPGIPDAIRRSILYHHLPGERGTDVRLLLEGIFVHNVDLGRDRDEGPDEAGDQILDAATTALSEAGLSPGHPVPIGRARHQGAGTFSLIDIDGIDIEVSVLGRFFSLPEAVTRQGEVRSTLERAGFIEITKALGDIVFDGLNVYFFGRREPLPVRDLLFYWQD